jgi:hypothetical protein
VRRSSWLRASLEPALRCRRDGHRPRPALVPRLLEQHGSCGCGAQLAPGVEVLGCWACPGGSWWACRRCQDAEVRRHVNEHPEYAGPPQVLALPQAQARSRSRSPRR